MEKTFNDHRIPHIMSILILLMHFLISWCPWVHFRDKIILQTFYFVPSFNSGALYKCFFFCRKKEWSSKSRWPVVLSFVPVLSAVDLQLFHGCGWGGKFCLGCVCSYMRRQFVAWMCKAMAQSSLKAINPVNHFIGARIVTFSFISLTRFQTWLSCLINIVIDRLCNGGLLS